jgi:hypothetical protein
MMDELATRLRTSARSEACTALAERLAMEAGMFVSFCKSVRFFETMLYGTKHLTCSRSLCTTRSRKAESES